MRLLNTKAKEGLVQLVRKAEKDGSLVFWWRENTGLYIRSSLLRVASAELLGRGTIGTTYKAVLDNQLICYRVKRLDASKTSQLLVVMCLRGNMRLLSERLAHPNLTRQIACLFTSLKGEKALLSLIQSTQWQTSTNLHPWFKINKGKATSLDIVLEDSRRCGAGSCLHPSNVKPCPWKPEIRQCSTWS
ncbi:hypothetical protein NC651_017537 [Populus alba x Populus x berolinensis]|nr:hypothetical protein NC651_017537 [Populus alba x Populus x berolinensis]